ncbi:hypothetical protein JJB07_00390 [Tumebacillus sp. ITR2]|uniref:Uncharacterized protein n=1 Tax=Tumebacillus amylolyticus TaxID=2801339 RepID=A0ABS1J492_9BACL|nr:hypothetical protein [Tumebacillus amylolyticus]MBL0385088.1 hypothetical protein [Tumebacillus amylolyticus]
MSDRNWDNPDWHEGMTLPSRKAKHNRKKTTRAAKKEQQQSAALQEIQQAREEATATSAAMVPTLDPASSQVVPPVVEEQAEDADGELQPFFKTWQRVLLWIGTILAMLFVLAWGKIGYVHHVPDIVRENVPAYNHGTSAYLVLKPWWFGPPVLDLNNYYHEADRPDWENYKARLGDYSSIVDNPHVLWTFPDDLMQ